MNEISIVTAFFDIGRGDWTPDKGLPHYLQRTTQTYLDRFAIMAKLENEMVVYTSVDLMDKVKELRGNRPTQIFEVDFKHSFQSLKEKIARVQNNPDFIKMINPTQVRNPEYWNADYVTVNALKSTFVNKAIDLGLITNDLVAWMDFGYCRDESTLNGVTTWSYPFDKNKIHFFNIKDYKEGTYIKDIIANNDVHITGPCIVGGKSVWPKLEKIVLHGIEQLVDAEMIDDDQTLLLMAHLSHPELFELHRVSPDDWFVAFRNYNETAS